MKIQRIKTDGIVGTRFIASALILVFAVMFLAACTPPPSGSPLQSLKITVTPYEGKAADHNEFVASDPILVSTTGRPQVIEFFAFWCTTCQRMRPTMHELQDEYNGRIDFLYINIDDKATESVQRQFGFGGLRPTIVFLDAKGQEIGRLVGLQDKDTVQQYLDSLVGEVG